MILFLRFRRATLLLTRGIAVSLRHQQALEAAFIGMRHQRRFPQVALPLGMLLGQDVALVRVMAAQPSTPRQPDALPECALGLLLRHGKNLRFQTISAPAPSTCCGLRALAPARSLRC